MYMCIDPNRNVSICFLTLPVNGEHIYRMNCVLWHIPIIPVLGRLSGADDEFKASLDSSGMQLLIVCLVTGPGPIPLHTLDELLGLNALKEQKGCRKNVEGIWEKLKGRK